MLRNSEISCSGLHVARSAVSRSPVCSSDVKAAEEAVRACRARERDSQEAVQALFALGFSLQFELTCRGLGRLGCGRLVGSHNRLQRGTLSPLLRELRSSWNVN